jgi:hypothetical protein
MQGRNDIGRLPPAADESELPGQDEPFSDEGVMAVTAIEYGGRVLTVVSRSDAGRRAAQMADLTSFTTILFGGPLGELTWTAETWINSLRNHETAVCQLIRSIASDCGGR